MSIKRQIQVLRIPNASLPYEYVMPWNKSWEILEIGANGSGAGSSVVVNVNGVNVFLAPANTAVCGICVPPYVNVNMRGFYEQLQARFEDVPRILVCPGEKLSLYKGVAAATSDLWIWFRETEAPDLYTPDMAGGSQNPIRIFIAYFSHFPSIAAGATEIELMDTSRTPPGFRDFPINELVHAGYEYDLLGLAMGCDLSGAPNTTWDGVRIWHEDESILGIDEDFVSPTFFPSQDDGTDSRIFLLPEPRTFMSNQICKVEMQYTNSGGAAESPSTYMSMILRVRPV